MALLVVKHLLLDNKNYLVHQKPENLTIIGMNLLPMILFGPFVIKEKINIIVILRGKVFKLFEKILIQLNLHDFFFLMNKNGSHAYDY